MADLLSYSIDNKVAVLQMDDGKANALSREMIDAITAALARAETEATAAVLVGRPDRFCAGFDLRVMMSGPDNAKDLLKAGSAMLMKLYGSAIPLVVACTGHALAGGALVVLTGDYRVCAAGAYRIGLNEVSIGLPVPVLAMELARDRLSKRSLVQATLLAQIYDPDGALRAGFIDEVVPSEQVVERAKAEAARLGGLPRTAFGATKQRLRGKTIEYITSTLDADMRAMTVPTS